MINNGLVTLFDPKRLQSWNTDRLEIAQCLREVSGHLKSREHIIFWSRNIVENRPETLHSTEIPMIYFPFSKYRDFLKKISIFEI